MVNNYKRIARGFQELDVGSLAPLDAALPELRALVPLPPPTNPRR